MRANAVSTRTRSLTKPQVVKRWCDAVTAADAPATRAAQQQPQNQWVVHPAIDGCNGSEAQGGAGGLR